MPVRKYIHTFDRLADVVSDARHEQGLSVARLAESSGLDEQAIAAMESGNGADITSIMAVLESLDITPLVLPVAGHV